MGKAFETRKRIWSTQKLEFNPPEKEKETKNDELKAPLVSSWESSDKNIERKEWRDFPQIKGYMIKKAESLKKKGGRAGKTKATCADGMDNVEKT